MFSYLFHLLICNAFVCLLRDRRPTRDNYNNNNYKICTRTRTAATTTIHIKDNNDDDNNDGNKPQKKQQMIVKITNHDSNGIAEAEAVAVANTQSSSETSGNRSIP